MFCFAWYELINWRKHLVSSESDRIKTKFLKSYSRMCERNEKVLFYENGSKTMCIEEANET